ncbi:MAG TPA: DUF1707 domain-containing protein [Streptosporangiaceae bacterium]|nr:DUF1707 domain-containing protein [Streptosporangiaceae bacterium]
MSLPQDPAAAGRDRLRAGHADREQVIDTLKDAFADGRLTRDELDARAGQAFAARTYGDLAALTADIPPGPERPPAPAAARPARQPAPARRRPLARAAAKSGICLIIAAVGILGAGYLSPGPSGSLPATLMVFLAVFGIWTALGIMGHAVFTCWDQKPSRRRLPPRPGPGGPAPDAGQRGGTRHGPVPPGPRAGQTRADLRSDRPRPHRQHAPARDGGAPRGVRPAPGAA